MTQSRIADATESIDLSTTAGKIAEFRRREALAQAPSGAEAIEKQHARGKHTARERIEMLLDEGSFVEFDALAVHRTSAFGMDKKRPLGDGLVSGYGTVDGRQVAVYSPGLHRLRRLAEPGQRREDRQGPGIRAAQRLPRRGHPRRRRRPHPGGRGLAGHVRRHLPQQRPRLRRRPADLADHGPVRRRRRLLPRADRLRDHGRQDQPHVHHRPRRHQDRHRRGSGHGDPGRGAPAQRHHRHRHLPGHRRSRRHRVLQGTAGLPALEQPLRGPGRGVRRGAGTHRRGPRAGRADPGLGQPALRHAQGHRAHRGRRASSWRCSRSTRRT